MKRIIDRVTRAFLRGCYRQHPEWFPGRQEINEHQREVQMLRKILERTYSEVVHWHLMEAQSLKSQLRAAEEQCKRNQQTVSSLQETVASLRSQLDGYDPTGIRGQQFK